MFCLCNMGPRFRGDDELLAGMTWLGVQFLFPVSCFLQPAVPAPCPLRFSLLPAFCCLLSPPLPWHSPCSPSSILTKEGSSACMTSRENPVDEGLEGAIFDDDDTTRSDREADLRDLGAAARGEPRIASRSSEEQQGSGERDQGSESDDSGEESPPQARPS